MTPLEPDVSPTIPAALRRFRGCFGTLLQVIDWRGETTFAQVDEQSSRIARGLLAAGVGKGTRVGILLPNGADYVSTLFGVTRMGGIAVLLSTFVAPLELAYLIRHADVDTLVTADSFLSHDYLRVLETALPSLSATAPPWPLRLTQAPFLRSIWIQGRSIPAWARGNMAALIKLGSQGGFDRDLLAAAEAEIVPADPAVMICTSGSTALPKTVLHSHGTLIRQSFAMSTYMTYGQGDRVLTTQPLFWVGGLCTSLLAANHSGAAVVFPKSSAAADILGAIQVHKVTSLVLTPAQRAALRREPEFTPALLNGLKPTSSQQLALFGLASPEQTPNALGMTETLGPHSMERPTVTLPQGREGSFGRGVGDMERKVVDPESGATVAPGERGELYLRGENMMLGFHRQEWLEVFERDGFYRTGDIVSISQDGYLFFHGRLNEMVKTNGANVSPREVELVLQSYEEILEAYVLGLPDAERGQVLVAAIVAKEGREVGETELKGRLRKALSIYKVPKHIFFLAAEEIVRTPTGKVLKSALGEILLNRLTAPAPP